jgi:uncharacterized membrane protein
MRPCPTGATRTFRYRPGVDPAHQPDPEALLSQPPLRPADVVATELEQSVKRCRDAVEEARHNLEAAQQVLVDAEKAVERAVMAEAFLRCVAPHERTEAP